MSGSPVSISGDVNLVPPRWNVILKRLPESDLPSNPSGQLKVTAEQAVNTTLRHWGASYGDIDQKAGVVWALFSQAGPNSSREWKVWVVTLKAEVMSQGPARSRHFIRDRLCTVIDAETGQFLMAYAAGNKTYVD